MYLNGNWIGSGSTDEGTAGQDETTETFSFQSTLDLQKGDQIWLEISHKTTGASLRGFKYTHFSGHLLEEKIENFLIERILLSVFDNKNNGIVFK